MKVLLISRDFYPSVGGIQSHVENLYRQYQNIDGIETYVLSRSYNGYEETDAFIFRISNGELKYVQAFQYVMNGRKMLLDLHVKYKFDAIHWHDLFFDSLLTKQELPGVRKIFTNHSSGFLEWFEKPHKKKYLRWLLGHADVILSPSDEINVKTSSLGLPAYCEYIPNGVDTIKFYPKQEVGPHFIRKKLGIGDEEFVVLCPRRLEPKNGVNYFIESAKYLTGTIKKPKYLIVGGGYPEERQKMENFIKSNAIDNVIFAGSVNNSEMLDYYQASDIVILPSLMEATSISGLEAMACGKPLIGTTVGGIPELISNEKNGYLIPPRDPKAIYDKIKVLVDDQEKLKSFSMGSRSIVVKKFSWPVIAEKILSKYN